MFGRIMTLALAFGLAWAVGCDNAKSPVLKGEAKASGAQPTKEAKEAQFKLGGPKAP